LFPDASWRIAVQGLRGKAVPILLVAPLRVAARLLQQAGHGVFGDLHETGRGPDATAFIQMADAIRGGGLRELRMEQSCPTSLRAFLSTRVTAQPPEVVVTRDLPDAEMPLARLTTHLACGIDTR
jgi:hypothetical protein